MNNQRNSKGRFTKGNLGKPKGAKNREVVRLRDKIGKLINDNFDQVVEDLKQLEPKARVEIWVKLLEYGLPKLQRTETSIDITKVSDQQVEELLSKVLENLN